MTEITHRRDRHLLSRPAARFRLAFTIWFSLAVLAIVLFERRHDGAYVTTSYLFVAILLAGFAGMLSYFAWLMYVPTISPRREDDIPIAKFLAGLATLIPPCVIGASMLPVGSPMTPWFVGLSLIVGCFALLTPHQEYLFARHTRRDGLLGPRLNWNLVATNDSHLATLDFSRLEYAPTTLGSTYARTMTRFDEPTSRDRRYEPTETQPVFRERQPVAQQERVVPPTRIAPRIPEPPVERRRQPEPVRVEQRVEPAPRPRVEPEPRTVPNTAGAATSPDTIREVAEPTTRKNKKQRRKERQAAREAEARAEREAAEREAARRAAATQPVESEPEPEVEELKPGLRDFVDADGVRCIEGIVEAVFQLGQKRTYAHVAFTPTFDRKPEVICEIADDSDARLKSPQAFSYGTRLELSRKQNVKQREVVHVAILARG